MNGRVGVERLSLKNKGATERQLKTHSTHSLEARKCLFSYD
jgi:hypothetical protein